MDFRKDINGLRAVAVLAVVLFHFYPNLLPGGFAGVDVFFVISGFLMTGIIARGMDSQQFSLVRFYKARAKRIVPALFVLCSALIIFGWFFLIPSEYETLGKYVDKSITFVSNTQFYNEAGYFDQSSKEKWLLHTWSLSVEWQFYIIYPLILLALYKFLGSEHVKKSVLVITVGSFLYGLYLGNQDPKASYFLLQSRAWEMLLGGVAYFYPMKLGSVSRKVLEAVGLLLILISYGTFSEQSLWPGYLALVPTLGAFFVIQAANQSTALSNEWLFQKVGKWSYSIYLWHWPFVVAILVFNLDPVLAMVGIGLSFVFGFLSYRFVESIQYASRGHSVWSIFVYTPILLIIIGLLMGRTVRLTDGMEFHYSDAVVIASSESENTNPYGSMLFEQPFDHAPFILGQKDNVKAVIVGDSHADAVTTALSAALDLNKEGLVVYTRASCPFILDVKFKKQYAAIYPCTLGIRHIIDELKKQYVDVPVFVVNRLATYIDGDINLDDYPIYEHPRIYFTKPYSEVNENFIAELREKYKGTLCELGSNHPVYLMAPIPEMHVDVPKTMARRLIFSDNVEDISIPLQRYQTRNKMVFELNDAVVEKCSVNILDPVSNLCDDGVCMGSKGGRPLYYDDDHLSEFGNMRLIPLFKNALNELDSTKK